MAIADYFVAIGKQAIAETGLYTVALSGGSSPKKLYELLASLNYSHKLDWQKVFFFFGDERNVPLDHPDSNYLMAKKALFKPLRISPLHTFPVNTTVAPDTAAEQYWHTIQLFFNSPAPVFNLVLLGLGDNSHTASLFPHTPVLEDSSPCVKEVWIPEQEVFRITLNAPLINLAQHIAFLVYGEGKAEAVHHVLEDEKNIEEYPAQLIKRDDTVTWFLDKSAAIKITST